MTPTATVFVQLGVVLLMLVSPVHLQIVSCTQNPIFILTDDNVTALGASGTDSIIISRQRRLSVANYSSQCQSTIADKMFNISVHDCEPYIEMTNDSFTYTWTIRRQPLLPVSSPVQVFTESCFNISCIFNKSQSLVSSPFVGNLTKAFIGPVDDMGEFIVRMNAYTDSSFSTPLVGTVTVPDFIYVEINETNVAPTNSHVYVHILTCLATPNTNVNDDIRCDIIEDGCAVSNPHDPDDVVIVSRNFEPRYGRFQFRSFAWTNDSLLYAYIHCHIRVCYDLVEGSNCSHLDCGSGRRKRRDSTSPDNHYRVMHGPIPIVRPTDPCDHGNGGCSDVCSSSHHNEVICSCHNGRELLEDEKTCREIETTKIIIEAVSYESSNLKEITIIFVAFLFLIMVLCFVHQRYSRNSEKAFIERKI